MHVSIQARRSDSSKNFTSRRQRGERTTPCNILSRTRMIMSDSALLQKISLGREKSADGGRRHEKGSPLRRFSPPIPMVAREIACETHPWAVVRVWPRPSVPLCFEAGRVLVVPIGRGPVHEVVPALIILNKSSPLRRLIIEFAVP